MKKTLLFLITFLIVSCNYQKDPVVAEIYHNKLYRSQLISMMPEGTMFVEDSAVLARHIIDDWLRRMIILQEAKKSLKWKNTDFSEEIKKYKDELMISAYYDILAKDSSNFSVLDKEVKEYIKKFNFENIQDREIVKLNWVKLSKKSKVKNELKKLLFDDLDRVVKKDKIEQLCADSLEYYIDDNTWLYLDEIQQTVPLSLNFNGFDNKKATNIETSDAENDFLIVLLDYKVQQVPVEDSKIFDEVKEMLKQQKREKLIFKKVDVVVKSELQKKNNKRL